MSFLCLCPTRGFSPHRWNQTAQSSFPGNCISNEFSSWFFYMAEVTQVNTSANSFRFEQRHKLAQVPGSWLQRFSWHFRGPVLSYDRCCHKPTSDRTGGSQHLQGASKQRPATLPSVLQSVWLMMTTELCASPSAFLCPLPNSCFSLPLAAYGSGLQCLTFTSRQLCSCCLIASWQILLSFLISFPVMENLIGPACLPQPGHA